MNTPKDKFEIACQTSSDDSYFYSFTNYTWHVITKATGDEIMSFRGYWDQEGEKSERGGVKSVTFSDEEEAVVVKNSDDTVERYILPADVKIADDGNAIDIMWPDGRTELRYRKPVVGWTTYGQPYKARDLVDEPQKTAGKKRTK